MKEQDEQLFKQMEQDIKKHCNRCFKDKSLDKQIGCFYGDCELYKYRFWKEWK